MPARALSPVARHRRDGVADRRDHTRHDTSQPQQPPAARQPGGEEVLVHQREEEAVADRDQQPDQDIVDPHRYRPHQPRNQEARDVRPDQTMEQRQAGPQHVPASIGPLPVRPLPVRPDHQIIAERRQHRAGEQADDPQPGRVGGARPVRRLRVQPADQRQVVNPLKAEIEAADRRAGIMDREEQSAAWRPVTVQRPLVQRRASRPRARLDQQRDLAEPGLVERHPPAGLQAPQPRGVQAEPQPPPSRGGRRHRPAAIGALAHDSRARRIG